MGRKNNKHCPTCSLPIPFDPIEAMSVPCTEYHRRCLRCKWPVAIAMMDDDDICGVCKTTQRNAERREEGKLMAV